LPLPTGLKIRGSKKLGPSVKTSENPSEGKGTKLLEIIFIEEVQPWSAGDWSLSCDGRGGYGGGSTVHYLTTTAHHITVSITRI
jgi:hypothetical protein